MSSERSSRSVKILLGLAIAALVPCLPTAAGADPALTLASNGTTTYRIVTQDTPFEVEAYAAAELSSYLEQITGATFPVIAASAYSGSAPAIFVGLSAPALGLLGGDPLAALADQEHVSRSLGTDIFLYGEGVHGNLHAVMEFLEVSQGWRWYSPFEDRALPDLPTVTLDPFDRVRGFSFPYREAQLTYNLHLYYQQGINMGVDRRVAEIGPAADGIGFVSEINDELKFPHTFFGYIPPNADAPFVDDWPWIPRSDYFATNPKWFSLWDNGMRVDDRQLCLSGTDLRLELTQNVLLGIAETGDRAIVSVSANDTPGPLCYCEHCQALMAQYQSPGGPLYDYLIELASVLATAKPEVRIHALAYRREQTQIPPTLPPGESMPANVVIDFAPIEDNYFADWTHPDVEIQETYGHLQAWAAITAPGNLWAWLYPNPWGTGIPMPVGNVERLITNLRLMHQAGVGGVFTDHAAYNARGGWSELQAYLYYRLVQDIDADTDAIIEEFMDDMYGPASADMRVYLDELEAERQAMTDLPPGVGYKSLEFDALNFPYLTAANIHRWQGYFDQMEQALSGRPERELDNVRLVRRELDLATLWNWFDLAQAYPAAYMDHTLYSDRITAVNDLPGIAVALGTSDMPYFSTVILGGGVESPWPASFDVIDPEWVRSFVPYRYRGEPRAVLDPEAAWGYAVPVDSPNLPFSLGVHQMDSGIRVSSYSLGLEEIVPGAYQLFALGEIPVTPETWIYFGSSWQTHFNLGRYLYEPDDVNLWEGYVSLKFDGPTYGGGGAADSVVLDRIFLVSCTDADNDGTRACDLDCNEANPDCSLDCTDADSDGICVTHDCDDATASAGSTAFGQTIFAIDGDTLAWGAATDVRWCKGELTGVSGYTTTGAGSLTAATSVDISGDVPSPGGGTYFMVREQGCGSWQTDPGEQPGRDAQLPLP
ncbi:MAG: DUF4838 domain-containing protein [bacterium]|nr:DUF4838 domain-containing protein [bacterium]